MSAEPVETLVERVREWVVNEITVAEYNDAPGWREDKEVALAALTELAERLEAAERETTAARIDRAGYLNAKVDAEELAEAAEARVAALEEALRGFLAFQSAGYTAGAFGTTYSVLCQEARAALRVEGDAANPASEPPSAEYPDTFNWSANRNQESVRVEGDEG